MLLFLSLVACSGGQSDAPAAQPQAAPAPTDAKSQLEAARKLLRAGKTAEAFEAAEVALGAHPEEDAAWDLVELAAIRAGTAGEMVDRLSADQALGGRADRHHALRGVLAVEANRLGDALTAAKALQGTSPGDAAAITALAVQKGAPPPEGMPPGTAALVDARDPARPLGPEAEALPGWRAALVRAEYRLARGDVAGAGVEMARIEAKAPRAAQLAAVVRIRAAATPDEAWGVAGPAVKAAQEAGDAVGAAEVLDAALPAAMASWRAGELAASSAELRKALADAGNKAGAARVALVQADAALRAGRPVEAKEAATAAAEEATAKPRASWTLALAAASLGDAAGVTAAATGLAEPRASAARALAAAMNGQPATFPGTGMAGDDAAQVCLLAAGYGRADAWKCAAAEAKSTDLALWARLGQSRAAFAAPEGASDGLKAELEARKMLAGGKPASIAGDHPAGPAWSALAGGAAVDGPGVAAWGRARAAVAANDGVAAAKEIGALAVTVPAWRSGPWAPLLALDGPLPGELAGDAEKVAAMADPLPAAVVVHGWSHRHDAMASLWSRGVSPLPPGAAADKREAVWNAVAGYRAGVLAWVAGKGAWPAAARTALEEAEKAAGLVAVEPPSLATVRSALDGVAMLSYRPLAGGGAESLLVTESAGRVAAIRPAVVKEVVAFGEALRNGDTSVAVGDRLRAALIDPNMDLLTGVGKYLVVGPPPMGLVPIAAMPEQQDGLRFLAAIRHVGFLPDVDALAAPPPRVEPDFSLTMLALTTTETDADLLRRVYPDATVFAGAKANLAAWRENAPKARFLHIGGFPGTPDGGFQLADGALTLSEIGSTPIVARGASLAGGDAPDVIWARIGALRHGGAKDVLVEGWGAPGEFRQKVLLHYWEGLNRRYSASRSLSEARAQAIQEVGDETGPVAWSGWFVSGKP
ncbi:MAG: hypothetical protein ACOZNI_03500 [Myxococcota bacterium]